jgi:hypothetical protein
MRVRPRVAPSPARFAYTLSRREKFPWPYARRVWTFSLSLGERGGARARRLKLEGASPQRARPG